MAVDATGGSGETGLEGCVEFAHGLPVGFEVADGVETMPVSRSVCSKPATRAERLGWLVVPAMAAEAASTAIGAGSGCRVQRGQLSARGVVCMDVDGQVEVLAQCGHELHRRRRTQQSGHILDREHVGTGLDDLARQTQVVVEGVELLTRIEDVRGVAQGHLGERGIRRTHGFDRRTHLFDVVECVEDAEDVDAGAGGFVDEGVGDLGRVRGVADGVAPAQQHLEVDVGHRRTQGFETLPGVFAEEAQGHIISGSRPRPRCSAAQGSSATRVRPRPAGRGCARGWPAGTGGRRGTSCR